MRKPGKPNSFLKGMQMDVDPLLQPKDSYRYAKNIRLSSYVGKNISVQPYDSDKLAFNLVGGNLATLTTSSISNITTWSAVTDIVQNNIAQLTYLSLFEYLANLDSGFNIALYMINGVLENNTGGTYSEEGLLEVGFLESSWFSDLTSLYEDVSQEIDLDGIIYPAFEEGGYHSALLTSFLEENPVLPTTASITGIGDINNDGIGLLFMPTITMSDGTTISINEANAITLPPYSELGDITSDPIYFETIIATGITNSENGITATVSWDETSSQVIWSFLNTEDDSTVSSMSINVVGDFILTTNIETNAIYNQWREFSNQYYLDNVDENADVNDNTFLSYYEEFGYFFENLYTTYESTITGVEGAVQIGEYIDETWVANFNVMESTDAVLSSETETNYSVSPGMQILGHYAFSDYLVILGTWIENENLTGYPSDFVLKTSQKKDGTLAQNPTEGIYELFFVGNLGFSNKKKLKVVGAEENESVRRIYFTDGEIPLRTMNVGADPSIYSQYTNDPGFFDLFIETKVSMPKVTGFQEGGKLESIGHAYAFRYKTTDGRMSRISPVCNPASLPVSPASFDAPFTQGGNMGVNTSKSIKGVIENLDTRYPFVEMIHIPYIGGAPGVAQVFATIPTPASETTLNWVHTGNEIVKEEIIALEFGADYVSWDTCQALEVKDNRLFVGNLTGVAESVSTDFTVASYNSWNQHHSYEGGNPHLFHDLLYSWAGVTYDNNGELESYHPAQSQEAGRFTKPWIDDAAVDMYRYIKGPTDDEGASLGLYTSSVTAPEYWSAENTQPTQPEIKRGILGAESKHFRTPLENGEYEGVRVTFRVLGAESGDVPAVELDENDKLITTGSASGARAPFYSVSKNTDAGGYYANYANPMYNSNYVGYRRGEIYRFGLLFYDKKGSPMFVKRIGDIRMPEHSTEYVNPSFTGSSVTGFDVKWPYYFQTSRSNLDGGFVDWPHPSWDSENYIKPYSQHDKGEGQKGCVLYPYFEVKLSSETCQKISGYSIVRVERTPQNRTISTSGILSRAVKYADEDPESTWNHMSSSPNDTSGGMQVSEAWPEYDVWGGANRTNLVGSYGNYHNNIFTPTIQDYRSHLYGQHSSKFVNSGARHSELIYSEGAFKDAFGDDTPLIGGDKHWSHSNIYTMDSPDAIINNDFVLNFSSGDRIKITEQRYCIKQPIKYGPDTGKTFNNFFNMYLADGMYGGRDGMELPDYPLNAKHIGLFACCIDPQLLKGEDVMYYQPESTTTESSITTMNFGGWKHKPSDNHPTSTDWRADMIGLNVFMEYCNGVGAVLDLSGNDWEENMPDDMVAWLDGDEGLDVHLGIYTKYYSKRIGAYPMYGMARPDWNNFMYSPQHYQETDGGNYRRFNLRTGQNPNVVSPNSTEIGYVDPNDSGGYGFGMNTHSYVQNYDGYTHGTSQEINGIRFATPCFTSGYSWKFTGSNTWSTSSGELRLERDQHAGGSQFFQDGLNSYPVEWDYYDNGVGENYSNVAEGYHINWIGARATNVIPDVFSNGHQEANPYGEPIDSVVTDSNKLNPWWKESNIRYAQVVSPGQAVSSSTLGSDRPFRNATMWHDPHRQNLEFSLNSSSHNGRNFCLGGNIRGSVIEDTKSAVYPESRADYVLSNKTIVMSLPHHSMLPITRHCLQGNNWRERVFYQFGGPARTGFKKGDMLSFGENEYDWENIWVGAGAENIAVTNSTDQVSGTVEYGTTGGGNRWSVDSPEVTMASIVKKHSANTLYGGNSSIAFSKNTFVSTGSFRQVNSTTSYDGSGSNGMPVFGGDTFIANFSLKKVHNPDTSSEYSDRGVLTAYTCPVETETNLDLRHGYFFGSDNQNIAKQIPDDTGNYAYNSSYDAENKIQIFSPRPFGFIEINHWPSTIAFSDPKMSGDTIDNYSIFPVNQLKDLDYTKGQITQMFTLQNKLFALQDSGTCQLAVNPRVMIPSGEGGAIQAVTGTDNVIERFDYVSESLGSQHFHGLAVTDRAAYYYDDNASKFLQLGVGKGGGFGVTSLGDSSGMQTFFQQYGNQTIYDMPLMSPSQADPAIAAGAYSLNYNQYNNLIQGPWGGINIGYDPEFGEVLLSICNDNPYTLVYNENLGVFSSFVSKRPSNYITYKNRLYCSYDYTGEPDLTSNNALYLSNGFINDETIDEGYRYLTFGGVDYYILGHGGDESYSYNVDTYTNYVFTEDYPTLEDDLQRWGAKSDLLSKEPVQIHFVLNDEPMQPKIFDNIDIYMNTQSDVGAMHLYFRKFTFLGSANRGAYTEYDASEFTGVDQIYSNSESSFFQDPGQKMWYSVKDGTHHIPLRTTGAGAQTDNAEPAVRGTYAIVAAAIGWDEGDKFFGVEGGDKIMKNEGFSILSLVPYYRYSRR